VKKIKILIDASSTYYTRFNTGIQRVVRNTCKELSFLEELNPAGLKVSILVNSEDESSPWKTIEISELLHIPIQGRFKRFFLTLVIRFNFLLSNLRNEWLANLIQIIKTSRFTRKFVFWLHRDDQKKTVSVFNSNKDEFDVLLLIDAFWNSPKILNLAVESASRGILVVTFIHDIFPITNPDWFPVNTLNRFRESLDIVLSVSKKVIVGSNFIKTELVNYGIPANTIQVIKLAGNSLGSHRERSLGSENRSDELIGIIIGTVEPRKGYDLLCEFLSNTSLNVHIHVVGKVGWKSHRTIRKIRKLQKLGRLTWHENLSDEMLTQLLNKVSFGLSMSESEGFGLPVVELLTTGIPVVARDIPIFREIVSEGIFYFDPRSVDDWERSILAANRFEVKGELLEIQDWKNFAFELAKAMKSTPSEE
jgi:glycosyltransferase involved in cell wall biosynthesis